MFRFAKMTNLYCVQRMSQVLYTNSSGGGWRNHTLSLSIERQYSLIKRGFQLVQHYYHDLNVLRYHGHPGSS